MYDRNQTSCKTYQSIATAPSRVPILPFPYNDQPNGIPWLYWGLLSRESTHNIRVRVIDLPLEPNSNSKTPNLNFVLGIYHLNGTFFGYQKVTDQLQICPTMAETNQRWQHPGTTYKNSCKFNIYKSSFNNFESLFYDLFIYDKNGALYPVPVRIKNAYTNGNIQNDVYTPNDNDTYVRRFSLFDTNVGTQNGQVNFIRIPQSIVIWFMIDSPGYVNVPVMDITYTERPISALSPTDLSEVSSIQFTFETRYIQNYSGLVTFSMIFFAIIATLMLLVAFHRTRAWYTRNLAFEAIDLFFLIRLIINLCESLASALFTFIVVLSLYFLVFFKTQSVLFLVVPSLSQEQAQFMLIIIGIAGIEFINITKSVLMQCTVELFFIDWEKSKGKLTDSGIDSKKPAPTFRKCNVEISLLGVLLFLEGFQWKNLGTNKPILSDLSDGDMNPILLFAADCICWGFMIFIQLSIRFVWYDRFYRNRVSQYIDIMSLTNISLLIFDERCHGYYIHGRSVHATADTDLENLNECLQKEASDLVPRRGYMDTNEQCFEIFVSKEFRNIFDKIYNPTEGVTSNQTNVLKLDRSQEQNRRTSIQGEKFVKTYQTMNKFMKSFLEMNMKEFPLKTREKTFFEKLVGATPESNSNTLLKDNQTITSCLLLGIEQHILVFYICTFSYLHITCNNSVWAAAVVWILDIILCFIRLHFGEMNIAKKSLLDSKFLI
ncbi:Meckelin [Globomyces pollinis-pini]|nr:Meckelin [Globomyces pollinis-pini]